MPGSLSQANTPRPLTANERKLDIILDEWPRLSATLYSGDGSDNADSAGLLLMPAVFTDTCWELDRGLTRMRQLASVEGLASAAYRSSYRHLRAWYFTCEKRTVLPPRTVRQRYLRGAREEIVNQPGVRWHVRRDADPGFVLLAVAWLALEFVGEPALPADLVPRPMAA